MPLSSAYAKLSLTYFFYFASLGVFVPYWSPYLESLGYGAEQIGLLLAVVMGTKIFAPYIWGWIADHSGHRTVLIRSASFLAALCFLGVWLSQQLYWLIVVMALYSFFWNAVLPQFEALTMNQVQDDHGRYSHIRLWGSVGFIVVAVVLGWLQDSRGMTDVPLVMLLMLISIALISLSIRDDQPHPQESLDTSIWPVLKKPYVIAFFIACFLIQFSHGSYYTFFSIYLEHEGYGKTAIGLLWGLGVVAEVLVFLFMRSLMNRCGIYGMLVISLSLTALRWVLIAQCVQSLPILLFAQTLHAASFGVFHAASIVIVHQVFKGKLQGRGQALYSSMSFGAGGAIGALVSGWSWARWGGEITYMLAAVVAALGVLVVVFGMRHLRQNPQHDW